MKLNRFLGATAIVGALVTLPGMAIAQATPSQQSTQQDSAQQTSTQSDPNLQSSGDRAPVAADTATPADPAQTPEEKVAAGDIVVTGSRIARPALESSSPITTVSQEELRFKGDISVGDALNDLPALRSTFSQSNSGRFIGTSGLNFLDLRGLGTSRTLVLVNGRRHVTSSPGDFLVDTNTIPSELIERVDIVTGGESAVYGSDAIAGVVNFILRRDFDGVRLTGQGGVSSRGDRGSYFLALTAGKNFAEGRGNISFAGEYSQQNTTTLSDRDYLTGAYSGRNQFNISSDITLDPVGGSDGISDRQFYRGVRNGTTGDGGEINAICPASVARGTVLVGRCRASRNTGAGANNAERYFFQPGGNLALSQPSLDFRDITNGTSSNTIGGLGSTLQNTGFLYPGIKRYSGNVLAHFDVADAFSPFFEGKYVHITNDQEGQPSFFQGSLPGFLGVPGRELQCSNPFLNAQALSTLQSIGRCANVATGTLTLSRFNTDFGGRGELHTRDTYRLVGGVSGTFNTDWNYEVSANYGHYQGTFKSTNNLILQNLVNAADAVRNAAGQIVCAINNDADKTNDDPACVPINLFGSGSPSQAALNYVNTTSTQTERATELVISGFVKGDASQLFELPGGPISFVLGAEYRRETAYSKFDDFTQSGATFLNSIPTFNPTSFSVKEAYGELSVPLLKDLPFAHELTVTGAGRVSDFKGNAGTVYAYNGGLVYAPIRDIRFRVNYSKSTRAPTLSDLYTSPTQSFDFIADPCDIANINSGNLNRAANCAAAGVPKGFINQPSRDASLSITQGGNQGLRAETGKSLTAGIVLQPRFLRGFSLTVDYYKIDVTNLIQGVSSQDIVNNCYDASSINNPFCALVFRNPDSTFADPAVLVSSVNFAKQKTRGIDIDVVYDHKFDNGDKVLLHAIGTRVLRLDNYTNVSDPNFINQQLEELGDPKWSAQLSANFQHGPVNFGYQVQYIGTQVLGNYEDAHSVQGRPPQNADAYPRNGYPSTFYHNARIGIDVNDKFNFYGGVSNIGDVKPPLGLTGTGGGSALYNPLGRAFYAGFRANY